MTNARTDVESKQLALDCLLDGMSIQEVSTVSGIPLRSLYHMVQDDPIIRGKLSEQHQLQLDSVARALTAAGLEAVALLCEAMADEGQSMATRQKAAIAILEYAIRVDVHANFNQRLLDAEKALHIVKYEDTNQIAEALTDARLIGA